MYRDVQKGGLWWVIPHVVVEDEESFLRLYTRPDTPMWRASGSWTEDERPEPSPDRLVAALADAPYRLVPSKWRWTHVLRLLTQGEKHAVELYWAAEDWRFLGWYVHLQTPYARSEPGFDKRDQALDITITPDRRWSWKDEHHLDALVASGYFTQSEHDAIRREADEVVEAIEAWSPPFSDGWEQWRPQPAWAGALHAADL